MPASRPARSARPAALRPTARAADRGAPRSAMIRIGASSFEPGPGGDLVPPLDRHHIFDPRYHDAIEDITENRRVMLIGHTGAGKTSFIEQIAARVHQPVLRANMNGQTTVSDFVGLWTVKGGQTEWIDGVLPYALKTGAWLIVDEIDFAEPSILAVLTAVLEPQGRLLLKEKGNEIIAPHPRFRLFATANTAGAMGEYRHLYLGANPLNEAFLDRWRIYHIDYLSSAQERKLLAARMKGLLDAATIHAMTLVAADCRQAFERQELSCTFSTRRLLDWARLTARHQDPLRAAEPVIFAKINPSDADVVRGLIAHRLPAR
ncbi:MAG: AAA family ATPase [Burkholderiaceae bacterium]